MIFSIVCEASGETTGAAGTAVEEALAPLAAASLDSEVFAVLASAALASSFVCVADFAAGFVGGLGAAWLEPAAVRAARTAAHRKVPRSEEHTSELQSPYDL